MVPNVMTVRLFIDAIMLCYFFNLLPFQGHPGFPLHREAHCILPCKLWHRPLCRISDRLLAKVVPNTAAAKRTAAFI